MIQFDKYSIKCDVTWLRNQFLNKDDKKGGPKTFDWYKKK